jgi:outer membrane protein with beta-barrel domain
VISRNRIWLGAAMALAVSAAAQAQNWQVGASIGLVNDVEKKLSLDEFHHQDVNAWVGFEIEDHVILLGTFGSLQVHGSNAGKTVSIGGGVSAPLPDLTNRINYGTLGVAYEFLEGDYASGLFAGFGGYRIDPEDVEPALEQFQDARETVWGWHVGADASFRVASRIRIIPRLTLHYIKSESGRTLLTANIGMSYKF